MSRHLIDTLATTAPLAEAFSDRSVLQAMFDFETALAKVEARLGVIPPRAAEVIAAEASAAEVDPRVIARDARRSGTVAIPVVTWLRDRVRAVDPASAGFVHWGATSQDVADTAMVLVLARAGAVLTGDHIRLAGALRSLSDRHAASVMVGRTLLQPATPVTFGLKVAGWLAAWERSWHAFREAAARAQLLQFGGASGTLAALGPDGAAVARDLAKELGLADPGAPWHVHRDRLAQMLAAAAVATGTLGKMARDVSLLMQEEVAEAREPGGGSSTMPHKRNPAGCATALAAATRLPGLVAAFLTGMVQEHERGVGGWHAEWPTIAEVTQGMGSALASMADVIESLTVFPDRMRENLIATQGVIFAERLTLALARHMAWDAARTLVDTALRVCADTGRSLGDVARTTPDITARLTPADLQTIDVPEAYLGAAEEFRQRLLDQSATRDG